MEKQSIVHGTPGTLSFQEVERAPQRVRGALGSPEKLQTNSFLLTQQGGQQTCSWAQFDAANGREEGVGYEESVRPKLATP